MNRKPLASEKPNKGYASTFRRFPSEKRTSWSALSSYLLCRYPEVSPEFIRDLLDSNIGVKLSRKAHMSTECADDVIYLIESICGPWLDRRVKERATPKKQGPEPAPPIDPFAPVTTPEELSLVGKQVLLKMGLQLMVVADYQKINERIVQGVLLNGPSAGRLAKTPYSNVEQVREEA